ncbi:hypothetical protein KZO83_01555 [Chromohalobacter sp. TMW 2.2308]|uniref:hypothetical protein n=1 Tax=Chromohalobacter TaxID=42054 RepID=UPI001FFCB7CD|nr:MULTISPECIES: hypothetical protein [Chromohalobacter]MCK2041386.1 hypothetical protein [Chromohalobacter moromii]MCT8513534.1 hypothetical protein [Chromohalobacter sp. TMW 2.2271]
MLRRISLACVVAGSVLLAGCGQDSADAPLAHVPADTPFLFANLDTLDDTTLDAALASSNASLPQQRVDLHQFAEELRRDGGAESLANVLDALTEELADKSNYQQVAEQIGVDLGGRSALYGLGLTPVLRLSISDAERYQAFLQRLADAAGQPLGSHTQGELKYRQARLGESPLQLLSAVHDGQAVLAVAPVDLDDDALQQLLGTSLPDNSVQDTQRLNELADAKGYLPYGLGYVDTTRLATLLTGSQDPMLQSFRSFAEQTQGQAPEPVSASCREDAARLASRMPQLSAGYTTLDAERTEQRVDVALAEDIAAPFAALTSTLPGLGKDSLESPFDLAIALPMNDLRDLLSQQIQHIRTTPFDCPALAELNSGLDEFGRQANMLAMPPLGSLRGMRLVIDEFAMPEDSRQPAIKGSLLVASNDPNGLLAIGQSMLPGLATLSLSSDGEPQALPPQLTAMLGDTPAWLAMTDKALGVATGEGEQATLKTLMKEDTGEAGELMHLKLSGDMYAKWLRLADAFGSLAGDDDAIEEQLEAMRDQFERIDNVVMRMRMEDDGLVIDNRIDWQQ